MSENKNEEEVTNEAIASVLEGFTRVMLEEDQREFGEAIDEALEKYDTIPSFSNWYDLDISAARRKSNAIISALFEREGLGRNEYWRLRTIYSSSRFFRTQVSTHISELEGSSCSVDKAVNLIHIFAKYEKEVRKGENSSWEDFTIEESWNTVSASRVQHWMRFIDSLFHLEVGRSHQYVTAVTALRNSY